MAACKQKLAKNLHWLFWGAVVLLTVYMDVYVAQNILDGDASQPFVTGWIIAQQKNLFTSDVYLTTEVGFLGTSTVAALFFTFLSDWTLVRILTMLVQQAAYVLAFLFLCRQTGVRREQAIWASGMLLLPVSVPYARIVLYHMYYLLKIAIMFWLMGLTARLLSAGRGEKRTGTWILLGVSWLLTGLEGIRYMLLLGVPMLAWLFFDVLRELKGYQWENGRLTGEKPFQTTDAFALLRIMLLACVCFLAGYVLNQSVLLRVYEVGNSSQAWYWDKAQTQRYAEIFHGWLKANGLRDSFRQLMSVRGIAIAATLFLSSYMISLSVRGLPGSKPAQSTEKRLIRGLYVSSLAVTTLVSCFDSMFRVFELYYLPVVVLSFPVLAQEMADLKKHGADAGRKLLMLIACLCILFQGAYSWYFIRVDKKLLDTWDGLSYTEIDTTDQVRDCVDFMQENGYTHAFINYWYAGPMVEMTDAALKVAPLKDDYGTTGALKMYRWGTFKSAFHSDNMPEKVVVFIKRAECAGFESAFPDMPLVHEGWIFNGYEADSSLID